MSIFYRKEGSKLQKWPLVSIVVLNYNGLKHLDTCLSSVFKTKYPRYEVFFVDNGSSDGSVDFVKRKYAAARVVQLPSNAGVSRGFNLGIIRAKGEYVATLNNDIELDPDWLLPLIMVMEKYPDVAAVDGKYINYYDRRRFDSRSAAGRYLDFVANPVTRGADEDDKAQYEDVLRVFYSCTLYRRDAVIDVGMFDEDFFYWYEDADLGWRLNLRGYKVMYVPNSRVYHKGGQTTIQQDPVAQKPKLRPRFYFLNKRNKLLILIKNYSLTTLLRVFPVILFEQVGYVVYWTIKRDKQYSFESLKALLWNIKNFKKAWIKHLKVQRLRKVTDEEIKAMMKPYYGDAVKLLRFESKKAVYQ